MVDACERAEVLRQTTYHMLKIGFQASQKGYRYLREAVWIAYSRPETLDSVTKLLYPELARLFSTTDKQIERAIRNAIETAWTKGEPETLRSFLGDMYGDGSTRPTNRIIIERLAGFFREPAEK